MRDHKYKYTDVVVVSQDLRNTQYEMKQVNPNSSRWYTLQKREIELSNALSLVYDNFLVGDSRQHMFTIIDCVNRKTNIFTDTGKLTYKHNWSGGTPRRFLSDCTPRLPGRPRSNTA